MGDFVFLLHIIINAHYDFKLDKKVVNWLQISNHCLIIVQVLQLSQELFLKKLLMYKN